jgi:hypothetical protein
MTDLIRQSITWPNIHGTRSYSRVTGLNPSSPGEAEKTESDRPSAKAEAEGETSSRRGSVVDISI